MYQNMTRTVGIAKEIRKRAVTFSKIESTSQLFRDILFDIPDFESRSSKLSFRMPKLGADRAKSKSSRDLGGTSA